MNKYLEQEIRAYRRAGYNAKDIFQKIRNTQNNSREMVRNNIWGATMTSPTFDNEIMIANDEYVKVSGKVLKELVNKVRNEEKQKVLEALSEAKSQGMPKHWEDLLRSMLRLKQ